MATVAGTTLVQIGGLLATICALTALSILLSRHRDVSEARWLLAASVMIIVWATGDVVTILIETLSPELTSAYFFAQAGRYVGIGGVMVAWFAFTANFTNTDSLSRPLVIIGIATVPALVFVVILTNPFHYLYWVHTPTPAAPNPDRTALFWAYLAFAYVIWMTIAVLMLRHVLYNRTLYRAQGSLLLLAITIPVVASIAFLTVPAIDFDTGGEYTTATIRLPAA